MLHPVPSPRDTGLQTGIMYQTHQPGVARLVAARLVILVGMSVCVAFGEGIKIDFELVEEKRLLFYPNFGRAAASNFNCSIGNMNIQRCMPSCECELISNADCNRWADKISLWAKNYSTNMFVVAMGRYHAVPNAFGFDILNDIFVNSARL
jgi:hypothetical protein